jgi:redox-sensing transcriptional repressor
MRASSKNIISIRQKGFLNRPYDYNKEAARNICKSTTLVINLTHLLNILPEVELAKSSIPDIIVGRLPLYLRALTRMAEIGEDVTSSHELGSHLGISSAQIRKDLSQFGEFGKQGTGYNINFLIDQLKRILNVRKVWDVALIGVGDLGRAVAHYGGFLDRGFRIVALFDSEQDKIGQNVAGIEIQDVAVMEEVIREKKISVAMLAVPASSAQEVVDQLVNFGVKAILSYAPTSLKVPEGVRIQYIDPVLHLQRMTYYLG